MKQHTSWDGKRGYKRKLSISEVVALNIIRFLMRINVLKTFHKYSKDNLTDIFLNLPNYENFLKAKHKSLPFIELCINYLLNKNRSKNNVVHFVDSTPITVSLNRHIYTYKVAKDITKRGKPTKGWF